MRSGVLTRERRSRTGPGGRGRTTNRYRLNESLLSQPATDDHIDSHIDRHIDSHSGSTYRVQSEAPTGQRKALSSERAREGRRTETSLTQTPDGVSEGVMNEPRAGLFSSASFTYTSIASPTALQLDSARAARAAAELAEARAAYVEHFRSLYGREPDEAKIADKNAAWFRNARQLPW